ncbi:TIGR01906 family membrane protein [Nesterenkonia sp. F]|uniref:TIGR01906 family membrane protein n=1 Tax=Nesterenkonia sp. F TaxID=795955 RepID=UPI000255D762|nr:TIGR01906 family membrane protein [Nesterenkonia sp. F]
MLLAIIAPLLVMAAAVRLVASPLFVWLEYRLPHFPADELGFGTDDRVLYGSYGVDYLFNGADSRYLSELAVEGGPLFTEAEVGHMADVKRIMVIGMAAAVVLLIITLVFALLLRRWRPGAVARGFFSGAWVALVLVAALVTLAVLGWQDFFAGFHSVLFAEGSWQFPADSTLIRLYPAQFWMDAAIGVGGLVVLIALLLLIITWPTKKRRARRRARLEEVQAVRREKLVAELTKDAEYSNAARG